VSSADIGLPATTAVRASPFQCKNGIVHILDKPIIQFAAVGYQMTAGVLQLSSPGLCLGLEGCSAGLGFGTNCFDPIPANDSHRWLRVAQVSK